MTFAMILPSAFIASREFPAMCAMTGATEHLQRVSVRVHRRKYQRAGGDMPWSVSLYLSRRGQRAVETVTTLRWLMVAAALVFILIMLGTVASKPNSGVMLGGLMILNIAIILVPTIYLQTQWKKIPVVFASAQDGCVEVQFPDTARGVYHACREALAQWEAERHRRREFNRREERFQRRAGEWGTGKHAAGASDRFADEVEPGWDEADEKSRERVAPAERRARRQGGKGAKDDW